RAVDLGAMRGTGREQVHDRAIAHSGLSSGEVGEQVAGARAELEVIVAVEVQRDRVHVRDPERLDRTPHRTSSMRAGNDASSRSDRRARARSNRPSGSPIILATYPVTPTNGSRARVASVSSVPRLAHRRHARRAKREKCAAAPTASRAAGASASAEGAASAPASSSAPAAYAV